ncbi:hypothetical protein E6C67_14190 [Azospirillum sp. TSA2s]|uniref:hypothetical protein n=1 Tax=Azospirillum sp. TSA2s TaxID=709810 RepID=UPI0010AA24FD|nr:hypothetical protein [Azospirillum sp. TSA2s]QCG94979.1 hypothetical protein E6C67_14190 [Azospirillum sp. TSA2s]
MTTATDATQVPGQGVSDAARDAGREIGQPEHVILGTDQGLARDSVEDKAAANARRAAEDRLARMMGLPEGGAQQSEAQRQGEQQSQPAVDADPAGQPRDDRGRFAPKEGEAAQAAAAPTDQAATQQPTAQQPTPVDLSDDAMVKVKVNGQEQMMRWGDARRSIQIESAARQRMEAATKAQQEATRLLEEARTKAQTPHPPQQPHHQTQPGQQPGATAADPLEALVDQIAYGDRDGIKSALAAFMEQGARSSQPPAVTPDALTGIVDQRLAAYQQTARAQGELQAFAAEHPEIVADEDLQVLVAQRVQKTMQQHLIDIGADPVRVLALNPDMLGRAYREAEQATMVPPQMTVFRAAAAGVKGKFAAPRPAGQTAIDQRLADKRAMPMQPSAAVARAPAPQEPRPPTAAEIIAAERRERGLTVY